MVFKLVPPKDPILRKECERFDFLNPPVDPVEFAQELIKTMYEYNGIGLAANQVGYGFRCFAMRGEPENFVVYNPKIVWCSDKEVELEESCLSFPGLIVKIKRPEFIRLRFNTPNSDVLTRQFIGMSARVVQHEMCHIMGHDFWCGISRLRKDQAFRKMYKRNSV